MKYRTVEWQDGLHQAVRDVRIALGDTNKPPVFIANVPRRGYKFLEIEQPSSPKTVAAVNPRMRYFGLGVVTFPVVFFLGCVIAVAIG